MSKVRIENTDKFETIIGSEVRDFFILKPNDPDSFDEPYCTCGEELFILCNSPTKGGELEIRVYVDEKGNLCVYTD